ncbi:unnamed protein product [Sphagnum balticum]
MRIQVASTVGGGLASAWRRRSSICSFQREPPTDEAIRRNAAKIRVTGSVYGRPRSVRPSIIGDHVDAVSGLLVQGAFIRTAASVEGRIIEKRHENNLFDMTHACRNDSNCDDAPPPVVGAT